ncbi:class II fumarate hydratase [Methylophaga sp. OBS4]|uniref:class II fumarate hydratase n=1 Tax=Methylophaga sp. OBS4 TaxID=2991935 RepID=UPI00224D0034|nr:class II fumarate hydratase [Methylophaga sp. OBS4]MCX4187202.1 class II fumarate hydratase [Methylophaga sp. OBS4]
MDKTHSSASSQTVHWAGQTKSALTFFSIGCEKIPPELIHAYGIVKLCAAKTNQKQGLLDGRRAEAIIQAATQIIAGELDDQFPLSIWQSGSGTQTNMNINEVLASVANSLLKAEYEVHANDHCNCGQSTNDSFPTALHIAIVLQLQHKLLPALGDLQTTLSQKASQWRHIIKTGRTHLQDATPLTLGQEFSGYAAQLAYGNELIKQCLPALHELTMGGTAVGTGLNTTPGFAEAFVHHVSELTQQPFATSRNCFATQAAHDAVVQLSGSLNTLAVALNKIANDIRLLASGPRCGLGELKLPANEPGSSIMPGKVNPSQCEMVAMVCAQVMGNHTTISFAGAQGQLELNTFKPVMAYNILQSIRLLADAMASFERYCIKDIQANEQRINEFMDKSLMLVTALTPHIGYDNAAAIANQAHQRNTSLREEVIKSGLLTAEEFDAFVQPEQMLAPQRKPER